jgi:hypothetical protein
LLSTFEPIKNQEKKKEKTRKKIQNIRGYKGRKPRRLSILVAKDQNV